VNLSRVIRAYYKRQSYFIFRKRVLRHNLTWLLKVDLAVKGRQTRCMAHIYMSFDFGTDEEKAQQARHKLEMWKQAFRLDKKLLYKFDRESDETAAPEDAAEKSDESEKAAKKSKGSKSSKSKSHSKKKTDADDGGGDTPNGNVKLYLRLAFSGHEKMTEERLLKKFPAEEPFSGLSPKAVKDGDTEFAELEEKFDSLE
jgi:hypothetical protein